jgi:hypothetical protein
VDHVVPLKHGGPVPSNMQWQSTAPRRRLRTSLNSCPDGNYWQGVFYSCFHFARRIRSIPSAVLGPVLIPPWFLQRVNLWGRVLQMAPAGREHLAGFSLRIVVVSFISFPGMSP